MATLNVLSNLTGSIVGLFVFTPLFKENLEEKLPGDFIPALFFTLSFLSSTDSKRDYYFCLSRIESITGSAFSTLISIVLCPDGL